MILVKGFETENLSHLKVEPTIYMFINCTVGNENGSFQRKYAFPVPFGGRDGSFQRKLEFVFYVKTDVSPLSTYMSKICKQEL